MVILATVWGTTAYLPVRNCACAFAGHTSISKFPVAQVPVLVLVGQVGQSVDRGALWTTRNIGAR